LHGYFDPLQASLSRAGMIRPPKIFFFLRGPMDGPSRSKWDFSFGEDAMEHEHANAFDFR
jgi:hypothetical protein